MSKYLPLKKVLIFISHSKDLIRCFVFIRVIGKENLKTSEGVDEKCMF